MESGHWLEKWQTNDLGFHETAGNQLLQRQLDKLKLPANARILVPLCGKSEDLAWLASRGYVVIGVELSEIAARDFFAEHGIVPTVTRDGTLVRYSGRGVDILVGDFFDVDRQTVAAVDGVYDRAALVALPPEMRTKYSTHLVDIAERAPQLLITFEYEQDKMAGPPFSIPESEVDRLYGHRYAVEKIEEQQVVRGLKGVPAAEVAWLLH
ncbi:MAG TPA: thiopurine S-methyltransferase [Actinobacteria bacterium]|nr:thiopurine S-methyltransferase [Actinomycetota bacterium]